MKGNKAGDRTTDFEYVSFEKKRHNGFMVSSLLVNHQFNQGSAEDDLWARASLVQSLFSVNKVLLEQSHVICSCFCYTMVSHKG